MKPGPFDQLSKALAHRPRLSAIAQSNFLPPASVKIELTTLCNHDCHFCAYRKIVQDRGSRASLDTERVLALINELAEGGVEGVMFTGGGEPLVHPGIERILLRCREQRLQAGLITNGSRLGRLSDEALLGLRWVRLSINASSDPEYQSVHGVAPGHWERVWQQVQRLSNRARFPRLSVGVSFVATTRNLAGLEALAQLTRDSGAEYLHVRPAFAGPHTELGAQLDTAAIADGLGRLEALKSLNTERFRVHGISRRFHEILTPPVEHIHCRSTPLVAYLLPTGDVSICTLVRDRNFNRRVPDPFLGNLATHSFFELWNTEKHRQIIEELSSTGCGRCHFAEYNRALALVEQDELHAAFL